MVNLTRAKDAAITIALGLLITGTARNRTGKSLVRLMRRGSK